MSEDTTIRDDLARERTVLANERTILAYARTALGLVGLAVVIFKFGSAESAQIFGSLSLLLACGVAVFGVVSYRRVAERISSDSGSREVALMSEE